MAASRSASSAAWLVRETRTAGTGPVGGSGHRAPRVAVPSISAASVDTPAPPCAPTQNSPAAADAGLRGNRRSGGREGRAPTDPVAGCPAVGGSDPGGGPAGGPRARPPGPGGADRPAPVPPAPSVRLARPRRGTILRSHRRAGEQPQKIQPHFTRSSYYTRTGGLLRPFVALDCLRGLSLSSSTRWWS